MTYKGNFKDYNLLVAQGRVQNISTIQKFGVNGAVGTTVEDIWSAGGLYTGFLQAPDTVRIAAGGSVDDDASGTGARSISVEGLDDNWNVATETIITNGSDASVSTTTLFNRIYRAYSNDVGSYTGLPADDISLETTSGIQVALIDSDVGQTRLAIYTVPAGKNAYITRVGAVVEGGQATDVYYMQRRNADVTVAPFTGARTFWQFSHLDGQASVTLESLEGPFPEKTDIWVRARRVNSGNTGVSATFDITLVDV